MFRVFGLGLKIEWGCSGGTVKSSQILEYGHVRKFGVFGVIGVRIEVRIGCTNSRIGLGVDIIMLVYSCVFWVY